MKAVEKEINQDLLAIFVFFIVLLETGILRFCMIVEPSSKPSESKLAKKIKMTFFSVIQSLAFETCNVFFFLIETALNNKLANS